MKIKIILLSIILTVAVDGFSQSVASSPYSLFGLGTQYDADFGLLPGIGSSGIALPSNKFINNLNPASLGFMYQNHFLFDVGGKAIVTSYQDVSNKETRNNVQFSHLAFAFPISQKSAFSLALKPYSSSSFKISNMSLAIKDSNENYLYSATGTGGLNDLDVSFGYRVSNRLALGLKGSALFGSTSVNENYLIQSSLLYIDKTTNYSGVRLEIGSQYLIDSTFTVATTIKSPTKINASKVESISTVTSTSTVSVVSGLSVDVNDYVMPVEVGFGISKKIRKNYNFSLDYQKSFWTSVNQSASYGEFVNQDKFAVGLFFDKEKKGRSYFDNVKYSTGFNYDTGYLEIDNKKIKNVAFSVGVSLPIDNTFSMLNISYSYGQKGSITNGLIKENYHKISLNLSLDGLWFVKRKFE